jgi:hypothetical protein
MAPVSNASNRSLSSSPSTIVPQVNAINNQQQQLLTRSNGTAGQNYTFASISPVVTSDKPMHLGYHGDITDNGSTGKSTTKSDRDHSSSTSKDKTSHDTKLSSSSTSDSSSKDNDSSDIKKAKTASDSDEHKHKNTKEKSSNEKGDSLEGILKEVL